MDNKKNPGQTIEAKLGCSSDEIWQCYQGSGLSKAGFAKELGLNPSTFKNWTLRYERKQETKPIDSAVEYGTGFMEVEPPAQGIAIKSPKITLEYGDRVRLLLSESVSPDWLGTLINQLGKI